ncbi:MAG: AMP-dependent synthetase/ligase [Spirochaetota bacterium]
MSAKKSATPWDFLEQYRGDYFQGKWPTIPEMFSINADRYPENRCFTVFNPDEETLNYREVKDRILQLSNTLVKQGVKHGDRIAVSGKNSPEWACAYLAVLYAGAVVVPLDYQLRPDEMVYLMKFSECRILFIDEEKYDEVTADESLELAAVYSLSPKKDKYVYDQLDSEHVERTMPTVDELAAILFTSGTTGNPKGVMLTHENLVSDCYLAQSHMDLYPSDVFYALLPIHHSYTMLAVFIESISVGAEIVFGKKIVVKQILSDLKRAKVTMFLGVPVLFNKLLKGLMNGIREKGVLVYGLIRFLMTVSGIIKKVFRVNPGKKMFNGILEKISLDNIRICICGGGPLPSSTFRLYNQLGIDFVQGYGLTETSPILTLNPTYAYKEESVGKVLPETEMKILEPDERGVGEIIVKGPMVMKGYYRNKEATEEIFTEDGWLKTGDVGYLDHDNYLMLTGRKKSLIVTEGGKNVFPEEIEDEFQLYDEIEQILVLGYEKDKKTKVEGIRALIYPAEAYRDKVTADHSPEEAKQIMQQRMEEIIDEVNKRLTSYKRIEKVRLVDEPMEMTSTKKIKRFVVAQQYPE